MLGQLGDLLHLALRQQAGAPAHAELGGDGLGGAGVVPGQHDALQPQRPQLLQRRGGVWPDLVAQRQQGDRRRARLTEHHHRLALCLQAADSLVDGLVEARDPARGQQLPEGAVDASLHPHARQGTQFACRGQGQPLLVGGGHHGLGQRVMGALLDGGGQGQQLGLWSAIQAYQLGQLRLAQGQGAGLVEGDRVHVGQPLQCRAPLDQGPLPGRRRQGGGHRRRGGDHQGAGAADEQQRQGAVDPLVPALAEGERRHQHHQQGDQHHGRGVPAAEAVDEALYGRALALGLLDEVQDAVDGVVAGLGDHLQAQHPIRRQAAGGHLVALTALHRDGFTGQGALIKGPEGIQQAGIGGQAGAGGDFYDVAGAQLVGRDLLPYFTLCLTL
ncbi:hypothetical protein D3C84_295590 [compost metagenome]